MIPLGKRLQSLGMKTAFDQPQGSANFRRMAPVTKTNYLSLSQVYHKTFLQIDEKETEAAAATAVHLKALNAGPLEVPPKPVEVKVDHPFLFSIQHRSSEACILLGRVTDPR
jgi:serpin B